ncbi:protein FAM227B [Struthio camelus]|uniref:protein FAM227B n=1 Tax=Struthio camelus TaxID=8801 RepID=UPI0036041AC2
MGKGEVARYVVDESKGRNIESYNYPGFTVKQLLELPRHLEAPELWDLVIKAQRFKKDVLKVWRSLFLSESSVAVFQDSFWWWFLQKFKPNQEDQDHLFDRIADNFVALFLLVPRDTKDAFFQIYPDCLSQVIYVAFCEAFPESIKYFDDEFKDGLVDLIFQWISGLKPKKCTWRKWNLSSFKTTMVNDANKDATANVQVSGSASSVAALENISYEDLLEDGKYMADGEMSEDSEHINDIPKESETVTESCYIGPGPECKRVLFRLGGQSPLVSYYLKMHEIANAASCSLTCRINRTEVYKLPPVAPTYQDVIKETRRLREEFQKDYTELQQKYEKGIEAIMKERKEIDQKFRRFVFTLL